MTRYLVTFAKPHPTLGETIDHQNFYERGEDASRWAQEQIEQGKALWANVLYSNESTHFNWQLECRFERS